jgi:hypothetical protein
MDQSCSLRRPWQDVRASDLNVQCLARLHRGGQVLSHTLHTMAGSADKAPRLRGHDLDLRIPRVRSANAAAMIHHDVPIFRTQPRQGPLSRKVTARVITAIVEGDLKPTGERTVTCPTASTHGHACR